MQKRILIVEGHEASRRELVSLVRSVYSDASIRETGDVAQAYRYAMEYTIDVFLVGALAERRTDVPEYRFIAGLRNVRQYMFAPVILISNIEDNAGYVFRTLHCYDCIERPYNPQYLRFVLERAACYTTKEYEAARVFVRRNKIVYSLACNRIEYAQVSGRVMYIYMQDAQVYEIPYLTIRRFLEEADYPYLFQCARNVVVNLQKVSMVDMTNRYIITETGQMLELGGAFTGKLKEMM